MPSSSAEDGVGDPNTMRILLATDIHLGYAEKHPVKGRQGLELMGSSSSQVYLQCSQGILYVLYMLYSTAASFKIL